MREKNRPCWKRLSREERERESAALRARARELQARLRASERTGGPGGQSEAQLRSRIESMQRAEQVLRLQR
jgi:hypothetical protein